MGGGGVSAQASWKSGSQASSLRSDSAAAMPTGSVLTATPTGSSLPKAACERPENPRDASICRLTSASRASASLEAALGVGLDLAAEPGSGVDTRVAIGSCFFDCAVAACRACTRDQARAGIVQASSMRGKGLSIRRERSTASGRGHDPCVLQTVITEADSVAIRGSWCME